MATLRSGDEPIASDDIDTLTGDVPVYQQGDSREAVLRAGCDVLIEHGWIRGLPLLSHTNLARAAHCAPSTVYRHWSTKDELASAVVTRLAALTDDVHSEAAQATLIGAVARGEPIREICRELAVAALDAHHAGADVLIALQAEARFLDDELLALCRVRSVRKRQPLAALIAVFSSMYGIQPRDEESNARAVRIGVSLSRGIASEIWVAEEPLPVLVEDFAHGILCILAGQYELAHGGTYEDFANARPDPSMAAQLRRSLGQG